MSVFVVRGVVLGLVGVFLPWVNRARPPSPLLRPTILSLPLQILELPLPFLSS